MGVFQGRLGFCPIIHTHELVDDGMDHSGVRYGGAIECLIPKGFADSSTVRTVPDYQEVESGRSSFGLDVLL